MAAVEPGTRQATAPSARARRPRSEQPELPYLNRELSWLEFNARVLHEARDVRNPLLERVKFLAIFAGNLDEFFQVRIAGLRQQVEAGAVTRAPDGRTPGEQLAAARERVLDRIGDQAAVFVDVR
jgi:polyphosphate kinase